MPLLSAYEINEAIEILTDEMNSVLFEVMENEHDGKLLYYDIFSIGEKLVTVFYFDTCNIKMN